MNTADRESMMQELEAIQRLYELLIAAEPTPEELAMLAQYPRMPRDRMVRLVAGQMVKEGRK
jgi:hypothetical protein